MTTPNGGHNPGPAPKTRPDATPVAPPLRRTTGGGHPRSPDGRQCDEPEVAPSTPSGVSSSWMDDPEFQAAAFEGLADNPTAQTYAEGKASPETRAGLLAARDAALISGTDPGSLAFIVRDLMDAAGYDYQSARPLHEQAAECCAAIRESWDKRREADRMLVAAVDRHVADQERLTYLVADLRKDLVVRNRELAACRARLEDLDRLLGEITARPRRRAADGG